MDLHHMQHTENLVQGMLGFLDSSEDDECGSKEEQHSKNNIVALPSKRKQSNVDESDIFYSHWNLWTPISNKLSNPIWRPKDSTVGSQDDSDWGSRLSRDTRYNHFAQENLQIEATNSPFREFGENIQTLPNAGNVPYLLGQAATTRNRLVPFVAGYANGRFPLLSEAEAGMLLGQSNQGSPSSSAATSNQNANSQSATIPQNTGTTGYSSMDVETQIAILEFAPTPSCLTNGQPSIAVRYATDLENNLVPYPPDIRFPPRMVANLYLSAYSNEAQYMAGLTPALYEQWIYAQMLQQQMYQERQHQLAAFAAKLREMCETNRVPAGCSNSPSSNSSQQTEPRNCS